MPKCSSVQKGGKYIKFIGT